MSTVFIFIVYFFSENATYLERFHLESITKKSTYRESDPLVPLVIHDLATQPIVHSGA